MVYTDIDNKFDCQLQYTWTSKPGDAAFPSCWLWDMVFINCYYCDNARKHFEGGFLKEKKNCNIFINIILYDSLGTRICFLIVNLMGTLKWPYKFIDQINYFWNFSWYFVGGGRWVYVTVLQFSEYIYLVFYQIKKSMVEKFVFGVVFE